MGCDIHLHVEKFENGGWVYIEPLHTSRWGDKTWAPQVDGHRDWDSDPRNRNYQLFAFLANVRNGKGFAGVDTGDAVKPQVAGRGIPSDTCHIDPLYDEEGEIVGGHDWLGEHSFTYATLHELLSLPWDMTFTERGLVTIDEYKVFLEKGSPDSWCGGVSGDDVRILSIEDIQSMDTVIFTGDDYIKIEWRSRPLERCAFRRWLINVLLPLSPPTPGRWACLYCGHMHKESDLECVHCKAPRGDDERVGDPRNIRVVMGFDS